MYVGNFIYMSFCVLSSGFYVLCSVFCILYYVVYVVSYLPHGRVKLVKAQSCLNLKM